MGNEEGSHRGDSTDLREEKCWDVANNYVNRVGKIAPNFASAIRAITMSELKHGTARHPQAQKACHDYVLPWLKRSPSLKAVFYFAAESMYEEELDKCQSLTLSKLLDIFYPGEVAAILGLVYLSKRLEKISDPTEWQRTTTLLQIQMELGSFVGENIPIIGAGTGMLIGGMRTLGYAVLSLVDLEKFKLYRRSIKQHGELFDLDYEVNHWGCNHLHIASLLVQSLGFGLQAGLGLGLGMAYKTVESPKSWFLSLDEETQCWQVALSWAEALHTQEDLPGFVPEGHELYLDLGREKELKKSANAILAKGSTFNWTERSREDLTEEVYIRLGLAFDKDEDEGEAAVFLEIEESEDYVDLMSDG